MYFENLSVYIIHCNKSKKAIKSYYFGWTKNPVESWSFGVSHYFIKGLLLCIWKQCILIILQGYL